MSGYALIPSRRLLALFKDGRSFNHEIRHLLRLSPVVARELDKNVGHRHQTGLKRNRSRSDWKRGRHSAWRAITRFMNPLRRLLPE